MAEFDPNKFGQRITDEVHAREQMSELHEASKAAGRAKDNFLAMLGHELRNPLAPLQTSLLPPHLPNVPGGQLAAAFHPAGQGLEVDGLDHQQVLERHLRRRRPQRRPGRLPAGIPADPGRRIGA